MTTVGDTTDGGEPETIKLAAPVGLTGGAAGYAIPYLTGAQLAVQRINESGGIASLDGAKLEILVQDSESDPQRAAEILRDQVAAGAIATIGPVGSGPAVGVRPTLESLGIPMLFGGLEPTMTTESDWVFRIVDNFDAFGASLMDFVEEEMDRIGATISSVGIIGYDAVPGPAALSVIEDRSKALGWEVVRQDYDLVETRDFATYVAAFQNADVDLILGTVYLGDGVGLAEALTLTDWRPQYGYVWSAGGTQQNEFREAMGGATEGWISSSMGPWGGLGECESLKEFAAEFESATGGPMAGIAASGPSAIAVIADALERGGTTDPEALRDNIFDTDLKFCDDNYFLAGKTEFSEHGDNIGYIPTFQQHQGDGLEQVPVWPSEVATREPSWPAYAP